MNKNCDFIRDDDSEICNETPHRSTRQSLNDRFDKVYCTEQKIQVKDDPCQLTQSFARWCDSVSSSLPNVNPKKALRNGADKISQTINNVRTTFGTFSQKLRKSTRRRQPLKNIDSPKTPVTPHTRSKCILGRTPTKLYSPFSFETPGKENYPKRRSSFKKTSPLKTSKIGLKKTSPLKPHKVGLKKKVKESAEGGAVLKEVYNYSPGMKFSNDLVQTQIGIYEFQSTANKIIQKNTQDL